MPVVHQGGAVVLRGGAYKTVGGCFLVFMTLVCLTPASYPGVGSRILGCVLAAAMGTFAWRWIRAQVRVESEVLVLRTPFRTHRWPWAEVGRADAVATNGNRLFTIVQVTNRDGRRVKVDGVGNRMRHDSASGTPVAEVVAEINRRVSAAM